MSDTTANSYQNIYNILIGNLRNLFEKCREPKLSVTNTNFGK